MQAVTAVLETMNDCETSRLARSLREDDDNVWVKALGDAISGPIRSLLELPRVFFDAARPDDHFPAAGEPYFSRRWAQAVIDDVEDSREPFWMAVVDGLRAVLALEWWC